MTEEEAKTKWCPMLQVSAAAGVLGTVSNRSNAFDDNSDRHGRCIGSQCMAWRWDGGFPLPNDPPAIREHYRGHCGLAGPA